MLLLSAFLCIAWWCSPCAGQIPTPTSDLGLVLQRHDTRYHVRLFNATKEANYIHGALELSRDGQTWGYVCDDDVDYQLGRVICSMFGYSRGELLSGGVLGQSQNTLFSSRLACHSTDDSLDDCLAAGLLGSCRSADTVAAICFNRVSDVFDLRLVDGVKSETQISGRLEVRLNPITPWGSVCDDSFNDRSATAACRFLGYKYGMFADSGVFGSGEQTLLDEVYCEENQEFLDCEHDPWYTHDCFSSEDVGVQCMNTTVRLLSVIANDSAVGSVELFISSEGGWFEVCDEGWDDNDARVVCRELGFVDGKALTGNSLGLVSYGSLTAVGSVTQVNCSGSEQNLNGCTMTDLDVCDFQGSIIDLAAVICYDKPASEVNMTDAVRIAPDPDAVENVGFLEIRHLGVWGRVCEDRRVFEFPPMGHAEASVACRMAGYAGGIRIGSKLPDSTHHIWLRGMKCNGTEASIDECHLPNWGSPGLLECEAPVRLICYEQAQPEVTATPEGERTGYIGIKLDGQVSAVCADAWDAFAASLACRDLGYSTGTVWSHPNGLDRVFGSNTVVKSFRCARSSQSLLSCITGGFGVPMDHCVRGIAGFACYDNLKLEPSHGFGGVPQFFLTNRGWLTFCHHDFSDKEAKVICRQLDYNDGQAIPDYGSYGPVRSEPIPISCNGSESSVSDCNIKSNEGCSQEGSQYATVSCFNTSDTSGQDKYRLGNEYRDDSTATGTIQVWRHNAWGYACDEAFTDMDAYTLCQELSRVHGVNYQHGVRFSPVENVEGPYWLRRPGCGPKMTSLRACLNQDYFCTESRAASVICSTSAEAKFRLENGGFSGRVQVSVNNQVGAICADSWDDMDAAVFCRDNVQNAVTGVATTFDRQPGTPLFLSGIRCAGNEDRLFDCQNDGWRNVPSNKAACQGDVAKEPGVTCFTNVVLTDGHSAEDSMSGRLSIIRFGTKRPVCFDETFYKGDHNVRLARLACKELGHEDHVAILAPYKGPELDEYYTMKNLNCLDDVTSLSECNYNIGYCSYGQVRLLCLKYDFTSLSAWSIQGSHAPPHGPVIRELPGNFTGVICPVQFTDKNATAVCMSSGSSYTGNALGSESFSTGRSLSGFLQGREPVWFGLPRCAAENGSPPCKLDDTVARDCYGRTYAAGVLCADNGETRIRLVDRDRETSMSGRVEILYQGQWGTVCHSDRSKLDAAGVCRQLGYPNGSALASSPKKFGQGSGPIYLKDVQCDWDTQGILNCANPGWQVTDGCTHDDDLEVMCQGYEQMFPEPARPYGAVASYVEGRLSMVCDDTFGQNEATVFCRSQGYPGGVPVCCNGFTKDRPQTSLLPILLRFQCQGAEPRLLNCSETILSPGVCNSYASVACHTDANADQYRILLDERDRGRVKINYQGIDGLVCANDITHSDASVICREAGFYSGLAFSQPDYYDSIVFWTSNLQCVGTEQRIDQCPGFAFGQVSKCQGPAVVMCLGQNDDSSVRVTLSGAPNRGRVQVRIQGQQGALCMEDINYRTTEDMDPEANVLCRQLGFPNGGNFLLPDVFPTMSGPNPVLISGLRCNGNESSIKECELLKLKDHDCAGGVGLQCYVGAQLKVIPPVVDNSHGILYLRRNGATWHPVCDAGITDREANVVCRSMGFIRGKAQCCNAVGSRLRMEGSVNSVTCTGSETDINKCTMSMEGSCSTGQYAYVHCSYSEFPDELRTLPMDQSYGNATVERYGISGGVCADGFGDDEATVMCRELGYFSGQAISSFRTNMDYLFLVMGINCTREESRISECSVTTFSKAEPCLSNRGAMILCSRSNADVFARIGSGGERPDAGPAELVVDGQTMHILADRAPLTRVATVFCKSVKGGSFSYGSAERSTASGTVPSNSILMSNVNCRGDEDSILDCSATFGRQFGTEDLERTKILYVECSNGARLEDGPTPYSGILSLYNDNMDEFGLVCMGDFGQNEADVACRQLGYTHSKLHCCMGYGYTYMDIIFKDVKCQGNENSLMDCDIVKAESYSYYFCDSNQDYVSLTCYNEPQPQEFNISIRASSPTNQNTGPLLLNHLGVMGTICNEQWGDADAAVACRQLGYSGGSAYSHYLATFLTNIGPFWTSNVTCQGTESNLADCRHDPFGEVSECKAGHYAGVICYEGSSLEFRISGTDKSHYGRVEAYVHGSWGPICDIYWDQRDAKVMCRTMGYVSGDVFDTSDLTQEPGTDPNARHAYELKPRCKGTETNINQCPHEGFTSGLSSTCSAGNRDAGVFCYTSVRLESGSGKSVNTGPVNYYHDGLWYKVCDRGFTDVSAAKVCQELGYIDGRAICCSAFQGESSTRQDLHENITIQCQGPESNVTQCVREEVCTSGSYASVVCFDESDVINESEYSFSLREDFPGAGRVDVTHLGVRGRICTHGWSDEDAQVFCKSKEFYSGFAYLHSYEETYVSAKNIGPYWVSNFGCDGTEASLEKCSFTNRTQGVNCSGGHTAAAVCFNHEGVKYRLSGGDRPNAGRIEMAIDRQWGTVCGRSWDAEDSRVACRNLGYTDGAAPDLELHGPGEGPIWLSYPQCQGDESALHVCPHQGFENSEPDDGVFSFLQLPCRTHSDDASLFCYKDVKLNQKLGVSQGALLFSPDKSAWQHVCPMDSFSRAEAQVACRSLMLNYVDGVPITGGAFGELDTTQGVSSLDCQGRESSLSECTITANTNCSSADYIGVACFKTMLTDEDLSFQVRLSDDSLRTMENHGIVEIRQGGVWSRICMDGFGDTEANVACKEIDGNFTGGTTYLHLFRNRLPMLWGKTTCSGNEATLEQCQHGSPNDNDNCGYDENDAGVLCYKGEGVKYRLTGGSSGGSGRVEVGVDGDYGTICSVNWRAANSRVLCRSLGYKDGITSHDRNDDLPYIPTTFGFFLCEGTEDNLLSCLNSGFDGGRLVYFCGGDAYTECYNTEVEITKIRLGDGRTTSGRVEVWASGLEEWGTVCDDKWDDLDATVVCRYLGFDSGKATFEGHEDGSGKIVLDNVECIGNETTLADCLHQGINTHNCQHSEDAGVECFNAPETAAPPTTTTAAPTEPPTKRPETTTILPPTTKQPSTGRLMTTQPRETTTAQPTSTASPTTTTSGAGSGRTEASSATSSSSTSIVITVVVAIIALILVVVVVALLMRYRIRRKGAGGGGSSNGFNHTRFTNDDTLQRAPDGSIGVSNQMFDIAAADTSFMAEEGQITFQSPTLATFSKPPPPKASDPAPNGGTHEGFSNPLYAAAQEANLSSPTDVTMDITDDGSNNNNINNSSL